MKTDKSSTKSIGALRTLISVALLLCPALASAAEPLIGSEHWVQSASAADGKPLKLYVWEKRLQASDEMAFARSGKVVLLAHGAGTPGRIVFDLQVPEKSDVPYSLMDYLAAKGFDVFAVEYQNYGRSDHHPCGLCVSTQVAANDVNATVDYIRKIRGMDKIHLLGWSWGTNVISLFTMQHPEKVRRLILYAPPVWTTRVGEAPTEQFREVTAANSRTLLEPEATDEAAVEEWIREVGQWGRKSPNGVFVDLLTKMPLTDPTKISPPTMMILGSLDRLTPVSQPNLMNFFASLPSADKQLVIVPGGGHGLTVQKPRLRFYTEVAKWLSYE